MAAAVYAVLALLLAATSAQMLDGNDRRAVSGRFNYFDLELLKASLSQGGLHNHLVSPASAKAVLAMLHEAARGETADQIGTALRLDGGRENARENINEFLRSLQVRRPGLLVEAANSVFVSPEVRVRQDYQEMLKKHYYSSVQQAPFNDPSLAASTINDWVAKHTRNFIRTLLSPQGLDPTTKAIIINAIFFKGKWTVPFDRKATTVRSFNVSPSLSKNAYFMESVGYYNYAALRDLNAEAVEIPYQGKKFSMIILRPNYDMTQMLRDLSYVPLNAIIRELDSTNIYLSIPRFSIEFETDLATPLQQLGIKNMFQPAANFSGMIENSNSGNIHITKFLQKTVIEVNEEGTSGASASGATAVPLMGPTIPRFRADKPFLFFIRDIETGNFLFEGLVEQPELADGPVAKPGDGNFGNGGNGNGGNFGNGGNGNGGNFGNGGNNGAGVQVPPNGPATLQPSGTTQRFGGANQPVDNRHEVDNPHLFGGMNGGTDGFSTAASSLAPTAINPNDPIHYPHI